MPSSRSLLSILLLGISIALTVPYMLKYFRWNTLLRAKPIATHSTINTPVPSKINMTRTPVYFLSHGMSSLHKTVDRSYN
jgi:hypothetical protein